MKITLNPANVRFLAKNYRDAYEAVHDLQMGLRANQMMFDSFCHSNLWSPDTLRKLDGLMNDELPEIFVMLDDTYDEAEVKTVIRGAWNLPGEL